MPRTHLSAAKDREKDFGNFIARYCYAAGGSVTGCAGKVGIKKDTLHSRVKQPDTFRLSELRDLRRGLHISKEDMLAEIGKLL